MYKLDLEKAEEPEIKLPKFICSQKKQGASRKASTSASLTTLKPLIVWITTNCGKVLKRWEYQPPDLTPEKSYAGQEATVRKMVEEQDGETTFSPQIHQKNI